MSKLRIKNRNIIIVIILLIVFLQTSAIHAETEETKLYRQGSTYCMQGQWRQAVSSFKELLEKYPSTRHADARFWMAYSYIEMGQYYVGISQLEKFASAYPASPYAPQALFMVGEVYEKRLCDYEKALKSYERVVQNYPQNFASLSAAQNQAVIYESQKKFEKAIKSSEEQMSLAQTQGISPTSPYVTRANDRISFIKANDDFHYVPLKMYGDAQKLESDNKLYEALAGYKAILHKYPSAKICDDASFRIIVIYQALGKKNLIETEASNFLKKYPGSPYKSQVQEIMNQIMKNRGEFYKPPKIYYV